MSESPRDNWQETPRGRYDKRCKYTIMVMVFNILANASFKVSALSGNWRGFLTWQVVGNLAGFITVLTLTGLLRFIPLHTAFTVTTGLAVLGVQVVASALFFHEQVTPAQWLGTLLVILGIALVSQR